MSRVAFLKDHMTSASEDHTVRDTKVAGRHFPYSCTLHSLRIPYATKHFPKRFPGSVFGSTLCTTAPFLGGLLTRRRLQFPPRFKIHFLTGSSVDSPLIPETGSSLPVRNMSTGTSPASSEFRQYRAPIAKATARQPVPPPTSVPSSVITSGPPSTRLDATSFDDSSLPSIKSEDESGLFSQVYDWLQHEKARRLTRKARHAAPTSDPTNGAESQEEERPAEHTRPSGSTFSLDKLEHILLQFAGPGGGHGLTSHYSSKRIPRRRPKGLRRGSASESDYTDVEQQVPNVEATLDNSKTLAYASSTSAEHDTSDGNSIKRAKDKEAWAIFKTEIVRLVHTLQLRGWRKMPRERAEDIEVVRLSGAMTNAIYVVAPPKNLLYSKGSDPLSSRRPPP